MNVHEIKSTMSSTQALIVCPMNNYTITTYTVCIWLVKLRLHDAMAGLHTEFLFGGGGRDGGNDP